MSPATIGTPEGTFSRLPTLRSSRTVTARRLRRSAATKCEPMKPAPPVTQACLKSLPMNLTVLEGVIAIHDAVRCENKIVKPADGVHIGVIKDQRISDRDRISYLRLLVQRRIEADHGLRRHGGRQHEVAAE